MRTLRRGLAAPAIVLCLLAALPLAASGQVQQIEPPWQGTLPPPGGVALLAVTRESTASEVAVRLEQEGCTATSIAVTEGGRWLTYIPGAPTFVNQAFPAMLAAGQGFAVRCRTLDQPVTLTEADDGRTVHRAVHSRLRVSLPANPSTGYAWRVDPEVPPSVLSQVGDPEFVGPPMPGAPGITTFEFQASGPGVVTLRLVYDRVFEADSVIDEWSVTVVVRGQQAVGWLGAIRTQPQAAPGARYLELRQPLIEEGALPRGVGLRASDGATLNAIESLTDTGDEVLVWGELTCGVADYGDCRIDATTILRADASTAPPPSPVHGWAGVVRVHGAGDLFQVEGDLPVQHGIAGADADIESQLAEARAQGTRIRVWGELQALVDDVNRTRIVVTEIALAP